MSDTTEAIRQRLDVLKEQYLDRIRTHGEMTFGAQECLQIGYDLLAALQEAEARGVELLSTRAESFERLEGHLSRANARIDELQQALQEAHRNRGACEVCWTVAWEPIEKIEDADGVNTASQGELVRCGTCWQDKQYVKLKQRYEEAEARVKELEATLAKRRETGGVP